MSSLTPEHDSLKPLGPGDRVAEFYLLGRLAWQDALQLQRRLVYEVSGEQSQKLHILFCEHPHLVTIGCSGSRQHVHVTDEQLRRARLPLKWASRGGGCILHAPGQLCVYPILSLTRLGWTVGEYMRRFQQGLQSAFEQMIVRARTYENSYSLGGRAGVLAAMGVAIQNWVTYHGAFINVNPPMAHYDKVDTRDPAALGPGEKATMSSLLAERRVAVTMPHVRAALVAGLVEAFDCSRHHIYTHHPLLIEELEGRRESIARVS
jgi:lipoyl(octanoyl) transferase